MIWSTRLNVLLILKTFSVKAVENTFEDLGVLNREYSYRLCNESVVNIHIFFYNISDILIPIRRNNYNFEDLGVLNWAMNRLLIYIFIE